MAVTLALLCTACNWWPFGDDTPYKRVDLWRQPSITNIGAPTVDDSSVYVVDRNNVLHRLARSSGTKVWSQPANPADVPREVVRTANAIVLSAGEVIAFSPADGSILWRAKNAEGIGVLESAASQNRIYPSVYRGTGDAIALDAASGREAWRAAIVPPSFERSSDKVVRVYQPRTLGDDMVSTFVWWSLSHPEVANKGGVAVLNATSGQQRWSRALPAAVPSASTFPSRVAVSTDVVVASSWEGYVFAYDRVTGDSLWTGLPLKIDNPHQSTASPDDRVVTIVGSTVVVGSGHDTVTAYAARTGVSRWLTRTENGSAEEMDAMGTDRVLVLHLNGGLTLFDCASGRMLWSMRPTSSDQRFAHVVVAGDTVFGTSAVGGVSAFRLVPK